MAIILMWDIPARLFHWAFASNVTGALHAGYASLAIDPANRPHAVYQRAQTGTNTILQYAKFDGTSWALTPESWLPRNATLSESAGIRKVTLGTNRDPSRFFILKR